MSVFLKRGSMPQSKIDEVRCFKNFVEVIQDGFTFPNCASRVLLSSPTLEMTILSSSTALQFSAMLVFLIRKVSLRCPTCDYLCI